MPAARCEKCGAEFERAPNESWKKLCYPCWREKQENSQVVALRRRLASLEDALEELQDALEEKDSLITSLDGLVEYQEQVIAHLKERLAHAEGWLTLLQQHSRFLLLACHPDRNPAHAAAATVVTQALLALRQPANAGCAPAQQ